MKKLLALLAIAASALGAFAQTTTFTYQGRLNDGATPANGAYDIRFALYDAASAGAQQGNLLTNSATTVTSGLFLVALDFGSQFPGANRWLEMAVRTNGAALFTTLAPRQQITSTPYALQAANAASAASATTAGTANNFSGSLAGNVTGPQGATVVGSVGGQSAANVASGVSAANAATSANTPNTIVKRDASGSFSAGGITGTNFTGNGGGLTNLITTNLVGTLSPVNFGLGQITGPMLAVNSVSATKIGPGSVVKTLNGLTDSVVLTAGSNITITPSGNNLSIAAIIPSTSTGWSIFGNSGSTIFNFIGTTDDHPLVFKVNGTRGLLIQSGVVSPSVIGGSSNNVVPAFVEGAVIGGGNRNTNSTDYAVIGGGLTNVIDLSDVAVIGGGEGNTIYGANASVISGGSRNIINLYSYDATIAGGEKNTVSSLAGESTIGGGTFNTVSGTGTTISGGTRNNIQTNADSSTIGGGDANVIQTNAQYATIGGGNFNVIEKDSTRAFIGGGRNNEIQTNSDYAAIVGGYRNVIQPNAGYSFIGGGYQNIIEHDFGGVSSIFENNYHVIVGGSGNLIRSNADYAAIVGGQINLVDGNSSVVVGGYTNTVGAFYAFIGGGSGNSILTYGMNLFSGHRSFIGGGSDNFVGGENSVVVGGDGNWNAGYYSAIGGGQANTIKLGSTSSVIAGGLSGDIGTGSTYATIGGGYQNTISTNGDYATIPGGRSNTATNYSFAAGFNARADDSGSFVWSDGGGSATSSATNNSVTFRARNGFRFFTASGTTGAELQGGATAWSVLSDRNAKKDFAAINAVDILEKLSALPITQWHYNWESAETTPHIGPMAQDFKHTFYPGSDDKSITTLEADGVAFAAIQGLNQKLEAQKSENAELKAQLAELKVLVERLAQERK